MQDEEICRYLAWTPPRAIGETLELIRQAEAIQQRAFEVVPYLPTGQWTAMTAYHKNVKGIINAPAFLMWNIEKT